MTKATLNPALRPFWHTKADIKVLKGGRDSTKTWDTAGFAIWLARSYRVKFLCMRQFQNKIAESVYAILVIQIDRFKCRHEFEILKTTIIHRRTGSSFHFYGIHRDIAEIKGFESANIGWIEEGEGLTKDQWMHIEPTIRREGAECWIVYNPRLVTDFVETNFHHDPDNGVIVRHINYDENPHISQKSLRTIERIKKADYDDYEHYYLGVPRTDDDEVIIKRSWVEAAIDAHVKLNIEVSGAHRAGFDPGDTGDKCSQIHVHGIVAVWGEHWKAKPNELPISCKRVYASCIERGADLSYDGIGIGAFSGGYLDEMNTERKESGTPGKVQYSAFMAGGGVVNPDDWYIDTEDVRISNKDFFENLKAQTWWDIARRFMNTYNAVVHGMTFEEDDLISIRSDMPNLAKLITELSTPRKKYAKSGKHKVESKDELKAREVESHNDADAFIMAYAPREIDLMSAILDAVSEANKFNEA